MSNPNGRPRKLTLEQEARVYAEVTATRLRRRFKTYMRLRLELGVSLATLERVVTRRRKQQLAEVVNKFHNTLIIQSGESHVR
jgi:hypothetical protein